MSKGKPLIISIFMVEEVDILRTICTLLFCRTFAELWDDDGETERERNKLISEVYNFVDIPTITVGDEDEMPLISFGTGPAVENETRWEIKEAIQSGHR